MTRPEGSKNEDYEVKRNKILESLFQKLVQKKFREFPSFRNVAKLLNVSPPTLKHYFQSRNGVMTALLTHIEIKGEAYLEKILVPEGNGKESIYKLLQYITSGFESGPVGTIHQFGLSHGMGEKELGPSYLVHLFEPLLDAVERRLILHQKQNELIECEPRVAALFLISPLFLVLLHQKKLGGHKVRPLNIDEYLHNHTDIFWKAFAKKQKE
ncbi:TetR/AcrR family transcriptional regulator [Leptospira jelokensis]|uniref:TetR/AcrR family transcriptional regulator n=1 Tax=Leptospira jelokensis TaxID=2484931 RepID=A0A4Z1A287_9LEPT|nr:TetR/AcrR family transcriptional regulator [Leptospira jelokensis]TGL72484.1 TetR/AcrR family transcriptional regulator [Leptospira jelokensis]